MIQLHSFWFAKSRRPLRFTLNSTLYSRNYFNASDIHDDYTIVNRPIIVRTGSCVSYYILNVPRWNNIPVKKLPNPILTNPRGLHCFVNAYFDIPSILSYNYTDVLTPWHASIAHFRIKLDISDCHGSFVYDIIVDCKNYRGLKLRFEEDSITILVALLYRRLNATIGLDATDLRTGSIGKPLDPAVPSLPTAVTERYRLGLIFHHRSFLFFPFAFPFATRCEYRVNRVI